MLVIKAVAIFFTKSIVSLELLLQKLENLQHFNLTMVVTKCHHYHLPHTLVSSSSPSLLSLKIFVGNESGKT